MSATTIRSVANTRLSLSQEEFEYYERLKQIFTEDAFRGLFQTDLAGIIAGISPSTDKATPNPVLFFLLNVSFNQRMRQVEAWVLANQSAINRIDTLEARILVLEERKDKAQ